MKRSHFTQRMFRAAAVFLLLFSAADLVFARTQCGEEQSPVACSLQVAIHSDSGAPSAQHDDCFCCCGHVDAGTPFVLIASATQSGAVRVESSYLPVAPTYPAFRPPRTA